MSGQVAAGEPVLAHLRTTFGDDIDAGADALRVGLAADQHERDCVAVGGGVLVEPGFLVEVVGHYVEVAVAIEVAQHRTVADRSNVETPGRTGPLELQVASVAQREVLLRHALYAANQVKGFSLLAGLPQCLFLQLEVGVHVEPCDAIRAEEIEPAIIVEIAKERAPGPIGTGDPSKEGGLLEALRSGVE